MSTERYTPNVTAAERPFLDSVPGVPAEDPETYLDYLDLNELSFDDVDGDYCDDLDGDYHETGDDFFDDDADF